MQSDHDYEISAASIKHLSKVVLEELLMAYDDDDDTSNASSLRESETKKNSVSEEMSQYLYVKLCCLQRSVLCSGK